MEYDLTNKIYLLNEIVSVDSSIFEDVLRRCEEFASILMNKSSQSGFYYRDKRAAVKPHKDIMLGKMGELFASYYMFKSHSYPFILPDFEIFKGNRKSWKEDLCYKEIDKDLLNLHVKTCDYNTRRFLKGDLSWTFQRANIDNKYIGRDNIYTDLGDNVIVFVYMTSFDINESLIVCIAPWKEICNKLKPPKKRSLRGIKECLYLSDLYEEKND